MRQGFTTVELLVTLFIASMMVVSGYQLYSAVTMRSARERAMSEASSIAYSRLRELSDYMSISTSCGTSHTSGTTNTVYLSSSSTLPGYPRVVTYRCRPFPDLPVLRVTAVVTYDSNPVREVVHAAYVTP